MEYLNAFNSYEIYRIGNKLIILSQDIALREFVSLKRNVLEATRRGDT